MGGVEQVIDQLASGTVDMGIHVDILSLSPERNPETTMLNGYTVHSSHLDFQIGSTGFSVSALRDFSRLAREADLIHYHFPWPFMDLLHFASRLNKPTVVTYHSDIVRQKKLLRLYRPLMKRFLGHVDHIVATSPNYLATSAVLARFKDKLSVIPIGLDKSRYATPNLDKVDAWRRRFGCRFFAFVGVLRYYKGLHILLEAAKDSGCHIVIAGAGPIERELKTKAAELKLENVHFLGYLQTEDKVSLLLASYGVVFPSHLRAEAFGISLLEGAMYGKPLISSEIGTGTSFINIANETGLVVPPSDPDALRQAMVWLLEHPEQAAAMGLRAEERYWTQFTASQMTQAYVKLYRQQIEIHRSK
jgi:glycosyltransferase involved in cell wall biosynthesis